jgi:hypothetical protein
MPAVAVVISLVATEIGVTGAVAGLTTSVLGAELAGTAILGATTVGEVATGALIGAGSGALTAAAMGGKPLKGALTGFATGGIGSLVSGAVGSALGAEGAVGPYGPQIPVKPELFGSTALGAGLSKGIGAFAGGVAGGLVGGKDFKNALQGGILGGLSSGLASGIGEATNLGQAGTNLLQSGLSYGLQSALTQQPKNLASNVRYNRPAPATGTGATMGSGLASAPSSYVPGGAVFGSSDTEKPPSNVWNKASLRNIGETSG